MKGRKGGLRRTIPRVQESISLDHPSKKDVGNRAGRRTFLESCVACVRVSTSFLEDSEDVSSLSEVKSVAKVEGKSS